MGLFGWLFGKKESPPMPSTPVSSIEVLHKIQNSQIADQISTVLSKTKTNLTQDALKSIEDKLRASAIKGESPRHCKAIQDIPDNFEWEEYNYWSEQFKEKGEWPRHWYAAEEYHNFLVNGRIEDFAPEDKLFDYNKDQLIELARKYNIAISKKLKKEDMVIKITQNLSDHAWQELNKAIETDLRDSMAAEKAFLFQHTISLRAISINHLLEHADDNIKWKAIIDDDCSFCQKFKEKRFTYQLVMASLEQVPSLIPPFHPGCMCVLSPTIQ